MKLEPIEDVTEPSYPIYRHPSIRRWLRIAAAAGATSMALWLGGCERCEPGRTSGESPPVGHPESEELLPGAPPPVDAPRPPIETPPPDEEPQPGGETSHNDVQQPESPENPAQGDEHRMAGMLKHASTGE